ncbi:hypothetical protein Halru_2298 [Halovivax ruber XH-70]|uniref:Uncharacterized protein n=1 Tax=Halovivax ruber (strain DSM 18193 / JCM 13892 / XH-70) TaxID=797302 RepID=L0IDI4_HALRX|nr:hypothetical protein [Halovivax ruber]AGB16883.1 hypothetical protein Halru_2298 [Halovivax ruber XH-70]
MQNDSSMRNLQDAPERVQKLLVGAVVAYFVLWLGSIVLSSPILALASTVLFGLIAIGIGVVLVTNASSTGSVLGLSGVALILGGVLELGWIVSELVGSGIPVASRLASLLVFIGILGYGYAVWSAT